MCIAISAIRFAGAVYLTVIAVASSSFPEYIHRVSWLISATFAISAGVDVIIASSMLYYLAQKRGGEMQRWVHSRLNIAVRTSENSNEHLGQNF
jgi:hypothetical protein